MRRGGIGSFGTNNPRLENGGMKPLEMSGGGAVIEAVSCVVRDTRDGRQSQKPSSGDERGPAGEMVLCSDLILTINQKHNQNNHKLKLRTNFTDNSELSSREIKCLHEKIIQFYKVFHKKYPQR